MPKRTLLVLLVLAGCPGSKSGSDAAPSDARPIDVAATWDEGNPPVDASPIDVSTIPDAHPSDAFVFIDDGGPTADASTAVVATCTDVCNALVACFAAADGGAGMDFWTCMDGCTPDLGDCSGAQLATIDACKTSACAAISACVSGVACVGS